jgi:ABC-type transport system involved in multi-copper enzyme maturation permease subunit
MRRLPEPPLDGNPVLWREWHRKMPSRWVGRFWTIYAIVSTLASLAVIANYYISPGIWGYRGAAAAFLAAQVNGSGVAIGLLLLSVSAATALAEERDRGSLDIIMATPLPTSTIVWGKWWGTFAMVPRLAILPIWVSAGLAMVSGQGIPFVLMVGLILAYAAAITSFGLALATWIPSLTRVVTCSVIVYLMVSVGWPVLVLGPASGGYYDRDTWVALSTASPFFGIYSMTRLSGWLGFYYYSYQNDGSDQVACLWAMLWIVVYGAVAAILAFITKANFERCLGRVAEKPRPRLFFPPPPAGKRLPGAVADALPRA